jgi:hypothetical protein
VVQNVLIYRVHAQTLYDKVTKENAAKKMHLPMFCVYEFMLGYVGMYPGCTQATGWPCVAEPAAVFSFLFSPFPDLKKTLAVLLDNILQRIGKLESKVDNLVNGTGANSTNSTTAVPSLVSLEKINVAGKDGGSMPSHGNEPF